jgi:hypothetical protein
MERGELARWIDVYERAWRTPGASLLTELFTSTATYRPGPFEAPLTGLGAIASFWEAERESPNEVFQMTWEPVAIDGDVGVVRVEVRYAGPPERLYRDLWIVTLEPGGRCRAFEEWPYFPGQLLSPP